MEKKRRADNICKGLKKDGTPCGSQSVKDEKYCFYHNPEKPEPQQAPKAKPLSQEDIEKYVAKLEGHTILPDFQLEKIADMVVAKLDTLKKEVAELKAQVEQLTNLIAPPLDKAEIRRLVQQLGPDEAAKEINRRAKLRRLGEKG